MEKFLIQDREINIKSNWSEVSLAEFVPIMELQTKSDKILPEVFLIELLGILSDVSSSYYYNSYLTDEEIDTLTNHMSNFMKDIERKKVDCFRINGNLYSYEIPNKLTYGEKISYQLLEQSSKSDYESWLTLLAILVRPAVEEKDEFGDIKYKVEPFNGDIDVLEKRKQLFKNIPAENALWIVENFINGKKA
jgi:hypothetical protein